MMNEIRWPSYDDLLEIDKDLLYKAIEAAGVVCYDAVNLTFTLGSSTSGMYPHWTIGISMSCTVYMDATRNLPSGYSNKHFNLALQDFIDNCEKYENETKDKKQI